jgi:peptidoglycan/xylan/chitin deacetylase (PgdA/CDA1 family)
VRPFTVTTDVFQQQLDSVVERGCTSLTVSQFREAMRGVAPLPDRPVLITFDDGFADFHETALAALRDRGLAATLYLTTGFLDGRPQHAVERKFDDRMLAWSQVAAIAAEGVEIGGHSHAHAHLDTLARSRVRDEVRLCKALLEDELGAAVRTFAYPHGYSSPAVRRLVCEAGYESACGVKNALSSTEDDPFSLARLTVRESTTLSEFRAWLAGTGARAAPSGERIPTRLWRRYRRLWALAFGWRTDRTSHNR